MVQIMRTTEDSFEHDFEALLNAKRETSDDVRDSVFQIIHDVKARGDDALIKLTNRFDRTGYSASDITVTEQEIAEAIKAIKPETMAALELAASRITAFHAGQIPNNRDFTDEAGVRLGERWSAVSAAGLYVPGGLASYPSSVLMNGIPAKVAGVQRVVMCVPTPDRELSPLVLAAAKLAGVDEIYKVGGAQAIAAMAYGTQTIAPVDKIVGPGNAWVAEAKRQVFGKVGIDTIAGPSEILVVADKASNPDWVAADLLSQAEHDTSAQSILITDDEVFADSVIQQIEAQLKTLPKKDIAGRSWRENGAIIIVDGMENAVCLIDRLAPEHLELSVDDPDAMMAKITHAGAIFLGRYTPEAIGDYVAGTNHVLPTARAARFSGGLSVQDFIKRTSFIECTAESLAKIGPAAVTLAEEEGLIGHARSVSCRLT